jgi:amino acid adenylation domain-containing protein
MNQELESLSRRFISLAADKRRTFVERLRAQGLDFGALPMLIRDPAQPVPLVPAQRGLWLAWQKEPQSPAYNLCGRLSLSGRTDEAAIRQAVQSLVARHEVLRTTYALGEDGQPQQRISSQPVFGWATREWALPRAEGDSQVQAVGHAFASQPFDLERGPVLRAELHGFADGAFELLVGVHHIAADGGSLGLLLHELTGLLQGRPPRPASELQYADHAAWLRLWLDAGELEHQLGYWREQLKDAPPCTPLPLDRPRQARRGQGGELLTFSLPAPVSQALKTLAREQSASTYMLAVALLNLLIHRYAGARDICIGSPSANRDRPELAAMVGHFTNVQVLRTRIESDAGFATLLVQVRDRVLDAKRHQEVPLDMLVEALAPERTPGLHPLFQVKCAQQVFEPPPTTEGGVELRAHSLVADAVHFDVSLDVADIGDTLHFELACASDMFDRVTVQRLADAFCSVAAQVAEDAQRPLATLALPGAAAVLHGERQRWDYRDVVGLFADVARRQREAPAIAYRGGQRSYGELDLASDRWAARLQSLGIAAESRVALLMDRTPEFVLALLAVMKAGAAFVPLDPGLPPARNAELLADCGASLVLVAQTPASPLPVPVERIGFDELPAQSQWKRPRLHQQQAAYLICTSGSTGRPKGVVVPHEALANYVQGVLARLTPRPGETFAMTSTVAADLGHTSLFGGLCSGGCLQLMDAAEAFDPDAFAAAMQAAEAGVLKIVPSHLKGLLAAVQPERVLPQRTLVLGGEVTDGALLRRLHKLQPSLQVMNHYGPTETTVGVLTQQADESHLAEGALPLGRPLPNVAAFVLDDELQTVHPGIEGELYLGGAGVARGYLGRAGLTASRFIASPFGDGERLYRTGDRVRQRSDGALSFIGRSDDQLKIRGHRVEPGELQARLRAHPGMADAVVVGGDDGRGGPALWAYVVWEGRAPVDVAALRNALQQELPPYLLPEAIVPLAALPLNANGKLDRKALPRPPAHSGGPAFEPPRGETEQALARLWAELLGVPRVSREDSFFSLGGDSILSLKLVARLRRQLPGGNKLSLADVMKAGSLKELAARLQDRLQDAHDAVCLSREGPGTPLYCLPAMMVNTREFLPIAQVLKRDRPVHAFVSHIYTARRWRGFAVEALASEYAAYIAATAGERCALLGWSYGGDLAFEVARQLQGTLDVAFIGMVDVFETEPLRPTQPLSDAQRRKADELLESWITGSTMADRWRQLLARMNEAEREAVGEQALLARSRLPCDGSGDQAAEYLLWATLDKRVQAQRYAWRRLDCPVHVWQAEASLRETGVLRDWSQVARVASHSVIPGTTHLDIVRNTAWLRELRDRLYCVWPCSAAGPIGAA